MRTYAADPLGAGTYELAEGPLWDDAAQLVRWVDINAATVLAGRLGPGDVEVVDRLTVTVTPTVCCVLAAADGGLLLGGRSGPVVVPPGGAAVAGPALVPAGAGSRLNDGAVDPDGRFVVGSMALDDRLGDDALYRLEPDGSVTTLRTGLTLANGLGWSPDGSTFFHVDTVQAEVRAFAYGSTGGLGAGRLVASGGPGSPDGMCVDAEGCLWVAYWGSGEVRRLAPTGELLARVVLPVPQPSSAAFVGPRRDLLLVTTAWEHMGPAERAAAPGSGQLFGCDVGTTGVPTRAWSGSTAHPPWTDTTGVPR